jgi:hypothetical protein
MATWYILWYFGIFFPRLVPKNLATLIVTFSAVRRGFVIGLAKRGEIFFAAMMESRSAPPWLTELGPSFDKMVPLYIH